jgi:hypothetical protein
LKKGRTQKRKRRKPTEAFEQRSETLVFSFCLFYYTWFG